MLVAVLLGGLVTANLLSPGTRGTPVATGPPGPPAVGDCLLSDEIVLPFWINDDRWPMPAAEIGPCTGPRFGEVVLVVADTGSPDGDPLDAVRRCDVEMRQYLGLPVPDPAAPEPKWRSPTGAIALGAGPDSRQLAVGQDWTVCLASDERVLDPTVSTDTSFPGPMRDLVETPFGRDRLGLCTVGDFPALTHVPCTEPHDRELLGVAHLDSSVERGTAEQSCTSWVRTLTGLTDPTAGGDLGVELDVEGVTISGDAGTLRSLSTVHCSIRVTGANRQWLHGSLLGLGDGPIPWG